MGAAVTLRNVIGETLHRFLVGVVPLHGHLNGNAVLGPLNMKDVRMQHAFRAVHVFDETFDAAAERKFFFLARTLVGQGDFHAVVKEGQFAQAFGEDFIVEIDVAENFLARQVVHLGAAALAFAGHLQRRHGLTHAELHLMRPAVPADGQAQPFRQGVDHGHADAVQTTGNLVGIAVEFAAGMQLGHHHFGG